jgi:hypothetical protein
MASPAAAGRVSPSIRDGQETTQHDSPARPAGKHDVGEAPDDRAGPALKEDPSPYGEPADQGGDIEEPEPGPQAPVRSADNRSQKRPIQSTLDLV